MKRFFLFIILVFAMFAAIYAEEKKVVIFQGKDGKKMNIDLNTDIQDFSWNEGMDIPNLTDEQETKIEKIEFDLEKTMIDLNASVMKKDVEIRELLANNANIDAVNKKIDEKGKILSNIEKKRMEKFFEVKKLLDKEQQEFILEIGPNILFGGGNRININKKIMMFDSQGTDEYETDDNVE